MRGRARPRAKASPPPEKCPNRVTCRVGEARPSPAAVLPQRGREPGRPRTGAGILTAGDLARWTRWRRIPVLARATPEPTTYHHVTAPPSLAPRAGLHGFILRWPAAHRIAGGRRP